MRDTLSKITFAGNPVTGHAVHSKQQQTKIWSGSLRLASFPPHFKVLGFLRALVERIILFWQRGFLRFSYDGSIFTVASRAVFVDNFPYF